MMDSTQNSEEHSKTLSASDMLRWLADARNQHSPPEGARFEQSIHAEARTARHLADILDGTNDARGWLPSWLWDEFDARFKAFHNIPIKPEEAEIVQNSPLPTVANIIETAQERIAELDNAIHWVQNPEIRKGLQKERDLIHGLVSHLR